MSNNALKEKWTVILHYCYLCQQNLKETSRKKCCEVFSLESGYACSKCRKKFSSGYELRRLRNIPADGLTNNARVYVSEGKVGIEVFINHKEADICKISDGSKGSDREDFSNDRGSLDISLSAGDLDYSDCMKSENDLGAGRFENKERTEEAEVSETKKGEQETLKQKIAENTPELACSGYVQEDNSGKISESGYEVLQQKDHGNTDPMPTGSFCYGKMTAKSCVVLLKDIMKNEGTNSVYGSNTQIFSDIKVPAETATKGKSSSIDGISSKDKMTSAGNPRNSNSYMITDILKNTGDIKTEVDSDIVASQRSICTEVFNRKNRSSSNTGMNSEVLIPAEDIKKEDFSDDTDDVLESGSKMPATDNITNATRKISHESFVKEDCLNSREKLGMDLCTKGTKELCNVDPKLDERLHSEDNLEEDNNNITLYGLCESESFEKESNNNSDVVPMPKIKNKKMKKLKPVKKISDYNRIVKKTKPKHSEKWPFTCKSCGYSFNSQTNLIFHTRLHKARK